MKLGDDPQAVIRRLYRDEHGYDLSEADEARVLATRSAPTYGELMPSATARLVEALKLDADDSFYDLGSGVGKVVLQVAMTVPVQRSIGIELVGTRHRIAQRMLAQLEPTGLLRASECRFRRSDFMRARLTGATVIYTCSTAFSEEFMEELAAHLARRPTGLRWVTTQDLDDNPWWELEQTWRLDMSWRRQSGVHAYRLTRRNR